MPKGPRRSPLWPLLLIAGALGLGVFGWMAWRAVTIEAVDASDARQRFDDTLSQFDDRTPLVSRAISGTFVRNRVTRNLEAKPQRLYALAYRGVERRLVRADVPLWFFTIKGPAVQYALQGTGFDLETLGLTAGDLSDAGAGVVLDEASSNGDRLLAWTR